MAFASLDGMTFRINPSSIEWGYQIDTNVEETIGGRVVQIIGATLSDITLTGEYGEFKGYRPNVGVNKRTLAPHDKVNHLSWELAENFLKRIRRMMDKQSDDSTVQDARLKNLDFKFPEYGWHFGVYIKGIDDGQSNAAITHTAGSFAYKWRISLFIVETRSSDLVIPGRGTSASDRQKTKAISGYISRISNGVGWKTSQFNQPVVEEAVSGSESASTAGSTAPAAASTRNIPEGA